MNDAPRPDETSAAANSPPTDASGRRGFVDRLFSPVDAASLAAFRIIFGGCMLFENARYYLEGYFHRYLIAPEFHFKFYGFTWVKELPEPLMHVAIIAMIIASAMVMVGAYYRASSIVLFFTFTYGFLLEAAQYRNHVYLLALLSLMMIFLPAHREWSVDAKRKPETRRAFVPQWTVWLMQFQLGLVYFFAGVAKLDSDWMNGSAMRAIIENSGVAPEQMDFLIRILPFFVWSGMLFDLLVPFALLHRRTRLPAYLAAAGFHLTNGTVLVSVGIFPWFMLLASTIFFAPNWPRVLLGKFDPELGALPDLARETKPLPAIEPRAVILSILAIHVAIQLFLPLRQHLPIYEGPTAWTHEGHRWAWRMKLVSKATVPGTLRFFTVDPVSGQRRDLDRELQDAIKKGYVHAWQVERMGRQPDLLLQYAKDLHGKILEQTGLDLPIYAEVMVTLNGRPPMPQIDSTIDLSKEEWTLGHARFIAPMQRTQY